jgi:hypothetical protein
MAVCLWDSETRMGGLPHSLIPYGTNFGSRGEHHKTDTAILALVDRMLEAGCRRATMQAKLFGGYSALSVFAGGVGAANIKSAGAVLAKQGIEIIAEDVLGTRGLIVCQNTRPVKWPPGRSLRPSRLFRFRGEIGWRTQSDPSDEAGALLNCRCNPRTTQLLSRCPVVCRTS